MKYGNGNIKCDIALFAYKLSFLDPITKERMVFELDLPNKYPFDLFQLMLYYYPLKEKDGRDYPTQKALEAANRAYSELMGTNSKKHR